MTITKEDLLKIAHSVSKDVPIVGGKVEKALKGAIESDSINHNGISDIVEILALAEGLIDPLQKIEQSLDFVALKKLIAAAEHEVIADKALLLEAIDDLEKLAATAKTLAGK